MLSGHPGLVADAYTFPLTQRGLYTVWADVAERGAKRIHLSLGGAPGTAHSAFLRTGMLNECHGGILLCDPRLIAELPSDLHDSDLWNFFADGLCFDGSLQEGSWKSNAADGNIVFVPSQEYYSIAPLIDVPGYAILCDQLP
jgi:hypothetical protein